MPNWKLHNDWATKLGIPRQIANWINQRDDLPKIEHCDDNSLEKLRQKMPNIQPTYDEIANKGREYLDAWILHILIDEIEDTCSFILGDEDTIGRDLYEETKSMFLYNTLLRLVPDNILNFLKANLDELIQTMPIPAFHIERLRLLKMRKR